MSDAASRAAQVLRANPGKAAGVGGAVSLAVVLALATPVVERWEGRRNDPYLDIAGIRTVCWGETANIQNRRYSDAECREMLGRSLTKHATAARACLPVTTPAPTQAAMISFAYNVGAVAACNSTAARKIREGDITGGCNALLAWNKARNPITKTLQVSKGLAARRADERALCLQGVLR